MLFSYKNVVYWLNVRPYSVKYPDFITKYVVNNQFVVTMLSMQTTYLS